MDTQKVFITYKEAAERYSLGLSSIQVLARKSGALRKIGRAARIDVNTMDQYLNQMKNEKE